jgi:RNA polymerase sigma-70 factor (ECF subfamily)
MGSDMGQVEVFNEYRPLLFSIAYRMLGSAMDAEDIVQEAFLRWQQASDIESPKSHLAAIVTRLSIDHLRLAQTQREEYIGSWLPEPLLDQTLPAPADTTELADSLSLAFLRVLEKLSPVERAVFLPREVFDYDYNEIARVVGKTEANCRQLTRRARQAVAAERPRFDVSLEQHQRLLSRFIEACAAGDMEGLLALLAEDVTSWADGGGKTTAALWPVHGPDRVARHWFGVLKKLPSNMIVQVHLVNGQPGVVVSVNEHIFSVVCLDIAGERIRGIYSVLNPEKLPHFSG